MPTPTKYRITEIEWVNHNNADNAYIKFLFIRNRSKQNETSKRDEVTIFCAQRKFIVRRSSCPPAQQKKKKKHLKIRLVSEAISKIIFQKGIQPKFELTQISFPCIIYLCDRNVTAHHTHTTLTILNL